MSVMSPPLVRAVRTRIQARFEFKLDGRKEDGVFARSLALRLRESVAAAVSELSARPVVVVVGPRVTGSHLMRDATAAGRVRACAQ